MRQYGFPLAPMILGVVLGNIAEINLIRAIATDDDLTLFLTRPWSLFFLLIAVFSVIHPWYRRRRSVSKWTMWYGPALPLALSYPMFMMPGWVRPATGVILLAVGIGFLASRFRRGWTFPMGK
jgi:putative tricarboxylic transport membrane protein